MLRKMMKSTMRSLSACRLGSAAHPSARCKQCRARPEDRCDAQRSGERTRGDRYTDMRDVIDGEAQARCLAGTAGWRMVVCEVQRERLTASQRKADQEREREQRGHVTHERERNEKNRGCERCGCENLLNTEARCEARDDSPHYECREREDTENVADRGRRESDRVPVDRNVKPVEIPAGRNERTYENGPAQERQSEQIERVPASGGDLRPRDLVSPVQREHHDWQ